MEKLQSISHRINFLPEWFGGQRKSSQETTSTVWSTCALCVCSSPSTLPVHSVRGREVFWLIVVTAKQIVVLISCASCTTIQQQLLLQMPRLQRPCRPFYFVHKVYLDENSLPQDNAPKISQSLGPDLCCLSPLPSLDKRPKHWPTWQVRPKRLESNDQFWLV